MTKQEKIQEAYGENWELVKNNVNQNGWIKDREFDFKDFKPMEWQTTDHDDEWYDTRRPISLKGIENNNDWIKIESVDDLPKEYTDCITYPSYIRANLKADRNSIAYCINNNITHYRQKLREPLY